MSLIQVAKILELYYSTGDTKVPSPELILDSRGVVGDKYYNKDIQRSVLIASDDSYKLAKMNGIDAQYGVLGENLLIDYNPYHLKSGVRLKVGSVVFEITQNCTLCNSLAKIDAKLPQLLQNDRGIFAKVIRSGTIYKGDNIYLLN